MGGFTQSLAVLSSRLHRHPLAAPDKDSTAGLAIRAKLVSHALFGGSAWAYFSVSVVQVFSVSAGARSAPLLRQLTYRRESGTVLKAKLAKQAIPFCNWERQLYLSGDVGTRKPPLLNTLLRADICRFLRAHKHSRDD